MSAEPENPIESPPESPDHLEELLDEALEESFPASDPPAVSLSDTPPAKHSLKEPSSPSISQWSNR